MSDPFPRQFLIRERFSDIEKKIEQNLAPLLLNATPPRLENMIDIAEEFIHKASKPEGKDEEEYLTLMKQAIYQPELLFGDYPDVLQPAMANPRMMWKLQNLRTASK